MGQQEDEGESNTKLVSDKLKDDMEFQSVSNKHPLSSPKQDINYPPPELPCCTLSKRFTVAWLACLGFIISFGIRCNLAVAIVKMIEVDDSIGRAEFIWSVDQIGIIDSAYIFGYIVTQIPGGYLSTKYPANTIFGVGIAATAALNLFVPMSARFGYEILALVRIFQGMLEGVTFPACYGLLRWWAPPLERTRLATIVLTGTFAGNVIGIPLSSYSVHFFGWTAPFYLFGVLGILWYMIWIWAIYEKPSKHPTIQAEEREYIEKWIRNSTMSTTSSKAIPWKHIFSSLPFLAICIANVCKSWTFYVVTISPLKYFEENFKMKVNEIGVLGVFPMLLATIVVPVGGILADFFRRRTRLSTAAVRKLFTFGGFGVEAGFLVLLGTLAKDDMVLAVICITLAVGFSGFAISGFNVNHLDIAPRYASILMGISNCVGMLSGFLSHIVVEDMTRNESKEQWQMVFIVAALINIFGVVVYTVFASGKVQAWAEPEEPPPAGYWENSVLQQKQQDNQSKNDTIL